MASDPNIPSGENIPQAGDAPPPLIPAPHPVFAPPHLPAEPCKNPSRPRYLLALLLTLFLGLFLADAFVSFADDSLGLFSGVHVLAGLRVIVCLPAMLMAVLIYGLMALTPTIPKRLFLPITLSYPAVQLLIVPFLIYCFHRIQLVVWFFSLCQVVLGLGILFWIQGGFKLRWPLVPVERLAGRGFSWRNLGGFALINVFVLVPATLVYLAVCSGLAVSHFSEGFMALHPGGFTVQARKYVRDDGKMIQLFPMSHVAEADFYEKISQAFPTNSIILMEGVTDTNNLLTNGISYKRLAATLGLAEQHQKFAPERGKKVRADIDVSQFSKDTLDMLNLTMLIHAKGVNASTLTMLLNYSPQPNVQDEMFDDILGKRNQHLLEQINSRLLESDNLVVPWGGAHIPEIAREIQKSGFRLEETRDYEVIRFHFPGSRDKGGVK